MNTILIIISLLITIIYLTYTLKLFGVPWSISDTYYKLENKKKGSGILFTLWTWTASIPLLIAWLNLSEPSHQPFAFFACGALMFVGAAAQFKQSLTKMVHYVSAGICVVSALIGSFLQAIGISLLSFAICIGIALKYSKWVTWIEIAALVSTYLTLLIL